MLKLEFLQQDYMSNHYSGLGFSANSHILNESLINFWGKFIADRLATGLWSLHLVLKRYTFQARVLWFLLYILNDS